MSQTIKEKIESGREYRKTQAFEIRVNKDAPEEKRVEGYATTFNEPYPLFSYDDWDGYRVHVMEQVDSRAFDKCDMSDVIMQYDHEGRVFARKSNGTLKLTADSHGLLIDADLGGTRLGQDIYEEIKGGYTTKMSFGFTVSKDKREEERDDENKVRTITRTILSVGKLYDVSAVSLPANDATEISARGYVDGVIAQLKEEFLEAEKRNKKKQIIKILLEDL